jgi:GNAT superfamily N-acetyltransferase
MASHPLLELFERAAVGAFPEVDGGVTYTPALADGHEAIICFTGHSVIASRLGPADFADLRPDGFGGAMHPLVQLRMAAGGTIGVNDVTLVAPGLGSPHTGGGFGPTSQWDDHERVAYARRVRREVRVFDDETGFVTIGYGLGGRTEMSIEVHADRHGRRHGRLLIHQARRLVAPDEYLFAAVSPGNARSLRAFLSQGFTPIGSEVIISPSGTRQELPG